MGDLLAQLREASRTHLAGTGEAALRTDLVLILAAEGATRAWRQRERTAWGGVRDWLAPRRKRVVDLGSHAPSRD